MPKDVVNDFLTAPTRERVKLATDRANKAALSAALGQDTLDAYIKLSARLNQPSHLAPDSPPNLLFVPGVMGSLLKSDGLGGIWWIDVRTRKHLDHLRLAPDGLHDSDLGYRIESCCVDISYEPFFVATLATKDFGHVGCHYDWRKPLGASSGQLRNEIAKAKERNGGERIHLVTHSMGGLFVRETLRQFPALWDDIDRMVFIGTPHYGSPAIAWYLKNHLKGFDLMAVLGHYLSAETFRSLWGVLALLPAPLGVYPGTRENDNERWTGAAAGDKYAHPCANFDMYNAEAWKLGLDAGPLAQLQDVLTAAGRFHRELYEWHLTLDQRQRDRMAVIAGVGYKTLFRLAYQPRLGFLWQHMEKTAGRIANDKHREGDGRVPLASATLEFVGETRFVRAEHGGLCSVPGVYEDVFRFLRGDEMELPNSPAGALGGHLAPDDAENLAPALNRAAPEGVTPEDPGYLQFEDPDPARVDSLRARVERETVPEFRRVRIL